MKNKLLFKIIRFFRALGIDPKDIKLDLSDNDAMAEFAQKLFGAILQLPDMESDYYEIITELYTCTQEEAEDKSVFEVVPFLIKQLKENATFSFGALTTTKK